MCSTPASPHRDLKYPTPPQGRSFTFNLTYAELQGQIQSGKVSVGSAIGTRGPACGDIVVRRSGSNAANPNRLYGSCSAQSAAGYKAFFWSEQGDDPASCTSKRLFDNNVPHTLEEGMNMVYQGNCHQPLVILLRPARIHPECWKAGEGETRLGNNGAAENGGH